MYVVLIAIKLKGATGTRILGINLWRFLLDIKRFKNLEPPEIIFSTQNSGIGFHSCAVKDDWIMRILIMGFRSAGL